MNTCKENNLQKNLDEAIANAANACKVICALNTRFAQHGFPMLVIGESHSIMGEKGNRTLCIDRDDLALLNAISIRETLKIADFVGKIKKNLDEAIANAANASKAICAINSHFAQHGIPMLVMSDVHKLMGEKGKKYLGINSDDLAHQYARSSANCRTGRQNQTAWELSLPPYQRDSQWRHPQGNVLGKSAG